LDYFNYECCYCGSTINLEQEHFIPLSLNGGYTKDNIMVACRSCNSSKNNHNFFDWYQRQSYYSKQREIKIIEYLKLTKKIKEAKI
jgi:5-methylcytosine-specific restriction endonuclease McrA